MFLVSIYNLPLVFIGAAILAPNHYEPYNTFYQQVLFLLGVSVTLLINQIPPKKFSVLSTRRKTIELLAFFGVLNTFVALCQFARIDTFHPFTHVGGAYRVIGNIAQANHFASISGVLFCAGLLLILKSNIRFSIGLILAVFLCIPLGLAQSRTTLLVSGFIVATLLIWRAKFNREIFTIILLSQLVTIVLWFTQDHMAYLLLDSDVFTRDPNLVKENVRGSIYKDSVLLLSDLPLWGFGWNGLSEAYFHLSNGDITRYTNDAHNIFLNITLKFGPIVGIGFAALVFGAVKRILTKMSSASQEYMIAIFAAAYIWLHGLLGTSMSYVYCLIPGLFLLYYLARPLGSSNTDGGLLRRKLSRSSLVLASIASIAICIIAFARYPKLQEDHFVASMNFTGDKIQHNFDTYRFPFFADAYRLIDFMRIELGSKLDEQERAFVLKVVAENSLPRYMVHGVKLLVHNEDCERAKLIEKNYWRYWGNRTEDEFIKRAMQPCSPANTEGEIYSLNMLSQGAY